MIDIDAIVLGEGITVLGTIRCLGAAGVRSLCFGRSSVDEKYSCYYHCLLERDDSEIEQGELEKILEASSLKKAVLIACSDHWLQQVANLPAHLATRFASSQNNAETLKLFTDKAAFKDLLERHNVPAPRTFINPNDLPEKDCDFFLKPRDSQRFSFKFKKKGVWVNSAEECRLKLNELKDAGFEMVIQEYIKGGPDQHIYVEGFRDRNGEITTLFARKRLRMIPRDFGNSTIMRSIPLGEVKQAADDIVRLANTVNYRGIFSAEFKYDERDRLFKLLEVNARPWWYIECPKVCGINFAKMAYLDALDLPVAKVDSYKTNRYFMNFFADFHLWHEEYRAGRARLTSFWLDWLRARATIFSWSDPLPGVMWVMHRLLNRIRGRF